MKPRVASRVPAVTLKRLEALARRHHISLSAYVAEILSAHADGRNSCPACRAKLAQPCGACGFGRLHNISSRPAGGDKEKDA